MDMLVLLSEYNYVIWQPYMGMKHNIYVVSPHFLRIKRMKKGHELRQKPQTYVYIYTIIYVHIFIYHICVYILKPEAALLDCSDKR